MAIRIVERELEWCQSQVLETLAEKGYRIDSGDPEEHLMIKWTYADVDKQGMAHRPQVRVKITSVSPYVTGVAVSFVPKWRLLMAHSILWTCLGLTPLVGLCLTVYTLGREMIAKHLLWLRVWAAFSFVWACLLVVGKGQRGADALEKHQKKVEQLLWERLDPEGLVSHEIISRSPAEISFFRALKWIFLCMTLIGSVLLAINHVFPSLGMLGEEMLKSDTSVLVLFVIIMLKFMLGLFRGSWGLFLLLLCSLGLAASGWLSCSWVLPHRYHWKERFYGTFILWCLVVSLPGLMILIYILGRSSQAFPYGLLTLLRSITVMVVLFLQALSLAVLLRILPESKEMDKSGDYYAAPSTRYEALSEYATGPDFERLERQNRFWTWATFWLLTTFFYLSAIYLAVVMVNSLAGLFGSSWALRSSWYWPLLVPAEGRTAIIQAIVLTCLMGTPLAITVTQIVRGRLRLSRKWRLSRELARDSRELGLPGTPLASLKQKLKTDSLDVALIPVTKINMEIERTAIFKRKYLLWISVGARKNLSAAELEALLWHECGHAALVKRTVWRELVALFAPWAARFTDLAEDLYERERQADFYAARKMGTAEPLLSALRRLKERQNLFSKSKNRSGDVHARRWISLNALKMVWGLGWAGYLHPNVDQRLRWLEET